MAEGGVSSYQLQSAISSLRSQLEAEIRSVEQKVYSLQNELRREVERLEREMREIGDRIVGAINQQTAAIVGGVAANTVMIETLKGRVEDEFGRTSKSSIPRSNPPCRSRSSRKSLTPARSAAS